MKELLAIFVILPILVHSSDVLDFKDSDFDVKIKQHEVILVEFFAPWCGHCKRLAPEYETAATALAKEDPPIHIAKVDCIADPKICEKHGVSGYPTLKVFKNGEFSMEYSGERTADGIIKYMISKSGPSSRELTSVEQVEKFLNGDNTVIVGFFKSMDSEIAKTFKGIADSLSEDFRFAHSTAGDVLSKYSYNDDIVLFMPKKLKSKFEEGTKKYTGDAVQHKIKSWIQENAMGIAGHRTASSVKHFTKKPMIIAYYDVDYEKNPKGTNYWRNRVMKVAKKFLDSGKNINFAVSSSKELGHEMNEFGLESPDNSKVYILARNEKDQKFKMDSEFSMEALEKWINEFLAGSLTPHLKSEPIPTNDEPVKVVVAKNFDAIVNDPTKDVLIEFYAPWCGHCKTLAPKYDELATKLSKETDIVIAKMDATANDVPQPFEVRGFPTLFFVSKNDKSNPKPYNGGREVPDFIEYLAKESTDPMVTYDRSGKPKKIDL